MTKDKAVARRETTSAEREARKAFREVEVKKALTDYEEAQKPFHENRERLKAERLAREAEASRRSPTKQVNRIHWLEFSTPPTRCSSAPFARISLGKSNTRN